MFVLVAVLLIILTFVYLRHEDNKKYKDIAKIPGPPLKGFLGNVDVFGKNSAETFQNQLNLVKEYGPFLRIWLGSRLTIVLADAEKMENILSSNEHISKSKGYDGFRLWLGNGLVNSTGDHWRKHRKIITPTFHFKNLEMFTEYMNSNLKILIEKLKKHVNEKSTDIMPLITNYNLDVISESAMRTKIDAMNNPKSEYVEAVNEYLKIYISRFFSFFKQYDFYFNLTSDYKLQKQYIKTLKSFTSDLIKKRKEERRQKVAQAEKESDFGIKKKVAFLDMLLDMENVLADEEIREEVDTFMFGGHHTVSSASTFCLLELANHPDIQKRLVEESIDILGEDKDIEFTMQNINEMKYLDMVVKESLRFRAPVPFIERELNSDIEIDGLKIPAGTTISMLIYALHRSEKYYPDPEKFDPDRFLPENCTDRNPYAYIPFSAGPRNCIGQKFAMLTTKALVIQILRNFEVLPAEPKFEPVLSNVAVLESENGICVQLKLRE